MEERQGVETKPHKMLMTNRKMVAITGVVDVLSFDSIEVLLDTVQGALLIRGNDLHVNRLSMEKGEIDLDGRIDSYAYADQQSAGKKSEGILKRLFQ